ncbi:response regulator [Marinoscillum sp. MHG1-6]|uniref:response regulator n=1 Tax=Marinoscillum sp. MHG1-6 TaxID=2959627 RepID=UPI002157AE7C|nr:response regulator [Marinoscillum sp. MHG1-6]
MEQRKLLVIEDNEEMRDNIVELLELSNYKVFDAGNGKDGVKQAIKETPDLIICDIMMPGMDGYEVLYLLSQNPSTSAIPFIFLTAKSEKSDFRKGMSMGADDYLTKPFEEMDLLEAVERRLKKYDQLQTERKSGVEGFLEEAAKFGSLENLKRDRKTRHFDKKESIFKQGDFPHYLYAIKSGKVKIFKINTDGKQFIHQILGPEEFMGQHALIQDVNHTEFAEALEPTEVILIPRLDFQNLIFQNREVSSQFIKMLSKDIVDKEHELIGLAYDTLRKRTADNLIKLLDANNGSATINISRNDLASMVGTATESVIRVLSEFKKDGLIKIDNTGISIEQPDEIRRIRF